MKRKKGLCLSSLPCALPRSCSYSPLASLTFARSTAAESGGHHDQRSGREPDPGLRRQHRTRCCRPCRPTGRAAPAATPVASSSSVASWSRPSTTGRTRVAAVQARRRRLKFDKARDHHQRTGERRFRQRSHVRRRRDDGRLVRAASAHRGMAGRHRPDWNWPEAACSSQRQHGASRRDRRPASLLVTLKTDPGSGHRRYRPAPRRRHHRRRSRRGLSARRHADAVRLLGVSRRHRHHHPRTFQSGRTVPQRRVCIGAGRRPERLIAGRRGWGKYVFTANTGSRTISRLVGTGSHVFVDSPVAASIAPGIAGRPRRRRRHPRRD